MPPNPDVRVPHDALPFLESVVGFAPGALVVVRGLRVAGAGRDALTSAGFAVAAFGALFETVADAQLARFKRDRAKAARTVQDTVMDRGLWRYSRHPNHFGEATFWWGL